MNEMDQLTRLRDAVPLRVTPRAEQKFRAALHEEHYRERAVSRRPGNPLTRIWSPSRLGVAVFVAAALVAGVVTAVLPSGPAVLTAKLLADRASAAALTQPTVNPGQWVYRVVEYTELSSPNRAPQVGTEDTWETADGEVPYGNNSPAIDTGDYIPSYSQLGSLPTRPAALDAYLAGLVYPGLPLTQARAGSAAFSVIEDMLENYVLPPRLEAEIYQALAIIPGIEVNSHVTAIDGRSGVAFVFPLTPQSDQQEIILNASTYSFLGEGSWGDPGNPSSFRESDVVRMVIVGGPGSTRPTNTPPSAAELLAEQADRSVTFARIPQLPPPASRWILRELATSSGDQTVWATASDSEQASFVGGKLVVCSRWEACASSTQWLMPAGPSYSLANPTPPERQPGLPQSLPQLLAALNTYRTGCSDVAGDCNAVNAVANMMSGYGIRQVEESNWFLMLADIPGVTVQRLTDVTGRLDLAFRYPFTDGITEILLRASTHQFAGFVRGGVETVITNEVTVSGPGSHTPVVLLPKPARLPTRH
jgi:hypothetical protein